MIMKKAFSLVEVITILFIVSVGLLGLMSLIIQNIQSQTYNKNNLIAYQLAQEGIELVRRVRDTNWLSASPYNENLFGGSYYMSYTDELPIPYTGDPEDLRLKIDDQGFYVHDKDGLDSGFSRLINIESMDAANFSLMVRVSWLERGRESNYDLQTVLYDWR